MIRIHNSNGDCLDFAVSGTSFSGVPIIALSSCIGMSDIALVMIDENQVVIG